MRRLMFGTLLFLAASGNAFAADPTAGAPVTPEERLGMRLFNQSCRSCHAENMLGAAPFAPLLWSESAGGDVENIKQLIAEGTERMPAWKYRFSPEEIAAIAAYMKTIKVAPELNKQSGIAGYIFTQGER